QLDYGAGGKWPVAADGSGATLAKKDPDALSNNPANWTSSVLIGGTPGARNFPAPALNQRRTLISIDSGWRFEASGTDLGTAWRAPDFDDSAWNGGDPAPLLSFLKFDGDPHSALGPDGAILRGPPPGPPPHGPPPGPPLLPPTPL